MTRGRVGLVAVLVAGIVAVASRAGAEGQLADLVPALSIEGSASGEGTLRLGLDYQLGLGSRTHEADLRVVPTFEASSNEGLATLFTRDGDGTRGAASWQLGVIVTHVGLQSLDLSGESESFKQSRRELIAVCDATCEAAPDSPYCKKRDKLGADHLDAADFCDEAAVAFSVARASLPERLISAGVLVGQTDFTYLAPSTAADSYSKETASRLKVSMGASLTMFMPRRALSFEIPVRFDIGHQAASRRARWCTPAGNVVHDPDGAEGPLEPISDAAEICDEQALGAPSKSTTVTAAGYVGYVGHEGSWRASVGPQLAYTLAEGSDPFELGVAAPLYTNYKGSGYNGLVRVQPSATYTRGGDGAKDVKVLFTIALLGDRTLFPNALQ